MIIIEEFLGYVTFDTVFSTQTVKQFSLLTQPRIYLIINLSVVENDINDQYRV